TVLFLSCFFFSSRRRHTRSKRDWSSDVCSSDLAAIGCDGARHRLCAIHLELAFAGAQKGYRRRIVLLAVCHLCCRCLVVIQHGLGLIALASGGGNGYQVLLPVLAAALTGNNRRYGAQLLQQSFIAA